MTWEQGHHWQRRRGWRRGRGWPVGLIGIQLLIGLAAAPAGLGWRQAALLAAGPLVLRALFHRPVLAAIAVGAVDVGYLWLGFPFVAVIPSTVLAVVGPIARARRDAFWQWQQEERRRREAEQQRRQEQQLRQAADERVRVARELHDILAHSLSLINVRASVALEVMAANPQEVRPALLAIKQASRDGLADVRAVLATMHGAGDGAGSGDAGGTGDAPRQPLPDLSRLDDLVSQARAAGLAVSVELVDRRDLPAAIELAAYRVVQEALTNVMRHSQARSATVELRFGDHELRLRVRDPGPPQRPAGTSTDTGSGLVGIRERATALGGKASAGPDGTGGFEVAAVLPVAHPVGTEATGEAVETGEAAETDQDPGGGQA